MTEDISNMTVDQYNRHAARTFADYLLGKRGDYLPGKYTGTEEDDGHPPTEAEKKKARQLAADLLAGEEVDDNPTPKAQRLGAHEWAAELMNNHNNNS